VKGDAFWLGLAVGITSAAGCLLWWEEAKWQRTIDTYPKRYG
jgi:hypothetical protein